VHSGQPWAPMMKQIRPECSFTDQECSIRMARNLGFGMSK
jgi:hypothetical protein